MASHGVPRTAPSRTKEQREQDIDKIRRYRALEDQVRLRAAGKQFDSDTFQLTSQLLRLNPEYYTIWNIRRRCLHSGLFCRPSTVLPGASPAETCDGDGDGDGDGVEDPSRQVQGVIRSELAFTVPLLTKHSKCYWIWKYRLWMLNQATDRLLADPARAIWQEELGLVSKMLDKDPRNFHAWGYRHHVVSQLESVALVGRSLVEPEFGYTTKMIHLHLSNFSAWHNRSQLIPRLLQERRTDGASRKEFLDAELALVRDAINVGPEDQSLWYYHQYLMLNVAESSDDRAIAPHIATADRRGYILGEMAKIRELVEDYADEKSIYEALVENTLAICRLDRRPLEDREKKDVAHWLGKLSELDPQRSGRWHDLEAEVGLGQGTPVCRPY